ncbi:uncharacterized protein CIMG_06877 [Coccidioides immitis RS]|uniref:Uncharacterized protein n=1 Tax=Coccidioides immitis (strain RS) TaxID=246410 RepID=J3K949_COCIM|nr:uncharacterized protein CIMG_06877 [Coccidioides immitis RS]EAS31398.3 hypothetical protein CIMG_06877 [Coccidioides immitis RS]
MGTQHCCFSPLLARPGKHTYGTAKLTRDAAGVESAGNHGTKSQGSLVVRYHSGILNQPAAASRPPGVGSSTLKHPPPPRRLRNNKGNIVTASRVNFNSVCSVLVRYGCLPGLVGMAGDSFPSGGQTHKCQMLSKNQVAGSCVAHSEALPTWAVTRRKYRKYSWCFACNQRMINLSWLFVLNPLVSSSMRDWPIAAVHCRQWAAHRYR